MLSFFISLSKNDIAQCTRLLNHHDDIGGFSIATENLEVIELSGAGRQALNIDSYICF